MHIYLPALLHTLWHAKLNNDDTKWEFRANSYAPFAFNWNEKMKKTVQNSFVSLDHLLNGKMLANCFIHVRTVCSGTHIGMPVARTLFRSENSGFVFNNFSLDCDHASTILRHFCANSFLPCGFVGACVLKCYITVRSLLLQFVFPFDSLWTQ